MKLDSRLGNRSYLLSRRIRELLDALRYRPNDAPAGVVMEGLIRDLLPDMARQLSRENWAVLPRLAPGQTLLTGEATLLLKDLELALDVYRQRHGLS